MSSSSGEARPRIAVFAGPTATILNSYPLTTSRKALRKHGLPGADQPAGFDALRPQRLARPVTVYIEQFSAHPLEADVAELYAPPDGYVGPDGSFSPQRRSATDKPVYEVELRPEDGLYPLPFMGRRRDGRPWDAASDASDAAVGPHRQTFYPDAARLFEEIDRLELGDGGANNLLSSRADYDFFRPAPSGGRPGEELGEDYFPYSPPDLRREPLSSTLAKLTNVVQEALESGDYVGGIWLEGSPFIEETSYWLNLLLDVPAPLVACAGSMGSAARANVIDAVTYLTSGVWADPDGRDQVGAVCVQDEQIFTAREVAKSDDRPGGYVATGGHGGVVGTIGKPGPPVLTFVPNRRHTWNSAVRITQLPPRVVDDGGRLLPDVIPSVRIVKHARYLQRDSAHDDTADVELLARVRRDADAIPLLGFVLEAGTPYGDMSAPVEEAVQQLTYQGVPFVKVGRGDVGGFVPRARVGDQIAGGNLTATKARLLLMACLLKFGTLPAAADPAHPTPAETAALRAALAAYQDVFDTH